ncbi:hypothetical protein HDU96_005113, partial [Phlyctochytrium bullatum]
SCRERGTAEEGDLFEVKTEGKDEVVESSENGVSIEMGTAHKHLGPWVMLAATGDAAAVSIGRL